MCHCLLGASSVPPWCHLVNSPPTHTLKIHVLHPEYTFCIQKYTLHTQNSPGLWPNGMLDLQNFVS